MVLCKCVLIENFLRTEWNYTHACTHSMVEFRSLLKLQDVSEGGHQILSSDVSW